MITIAVLANSPGAANTLNPILDLLDAKLNISFMLFLSKEAKEKLTTLKNFKEYSVETFNNQFLINHPIKCMISGTSYPPHHEILFWEYAITNKIPCIAMVDQWLNYKERFWLPENKNKVTIPDLITVIDNYSKNDMTQLGFPKEKIMSIGSKYLENFELKTPTNRNINITEKEKISFLFVAEPRSVENEIPHGYTEYEILEKFSHILNKAFPNIKAHFKIKLHPRHPNNAFRDFKLNYSNQSFEIIHLGTSKESILSSDIVVGMSSMMLLEAILLKIPTMSVQIGLNTSDPFVLSQRGILPSALNEAEVILQLKKIFSGNYPKWHAPKCEIKKLYDWIVSKIDV